MSISGDPLTLDLYYCRPTPSEPLSPDCPFPGLQERLFDLKPLTAGYRLHLRRADWTPHFWEVVRSIPRGTTVSYADLCRLNDLPDRYARAVGTLLGTNEYALLVPCHRVIHADGSLGKYKWGSEYKAQLQNYEKRLLRLESPMSPPDDLIR